MGSIADPVANCCWVTLVTVPSYLPGVVILAHSLDTVRSKYPLVVQYTSKLGDEAVAALQAEATKRKRIILDPVELLVPRNGYENVGSVAERFKDTFTKLRAFEMYKHGFTKTCFLDADMAVFQNPDPIFDITLPGKDWLVANHSCVCNLDKDAWASSIWNKGNCAYTTLTDPSQVFKNTSKDCRPTYRLLNGGCFLFHPSEELWKNMLKFFNTTDKLKNYQFPDQDFLAEFFWDKWQPCSWKYNALKTMRYWHPKLWSDKEVAIVHYIVDKPWDRKISSEGIAGHLGRDGVTHQWWWDYYQDWLSDRRKSDSIAISVVGKLVAKKEPFTKTVPLADEPGTLKDVVKFLPN